MVHHYILHQSAPLYVAHHSMVHHRMYLGSKSGCAAPADAARVVGVLHELAQAAGHRGQAELLAPARVQALQDLGTRYRV